MASETIQSDPGDECDATGCGCGQRSIYTSDWREPRGGTLTPNEVEEFRRVAREAAAEAMEVVRLRRMSPAVQPEERKP